MKPSGSGTLRTNNQGKRSGSHAKSPTHNADRSAQNSKASSHSSHNRRVITAGTMYDDDDDAKDGTASSDDSDSGDLSTAYNYGDSFISRTGRAKVSPADSMLDKAFESEAEYLVPIWCQEASTPPQGQDTPSPWWKALAFADSGCQVFQCSYAFATRHGLQLLTPSAPTRVQVPVGETAPIEVPIKHQVLLRMRCKSRTITARANVSHQADDLLLGRRERAAFGIEVVGIPIQFDEDPACPQGPSLDPSPPLTEQQLQAEQVAADFYTLADTIVPEAKARLDAALAPLLAANALIRQGDFSTHPAAPVSIATGTVESSMHRQYPLSDAAKMFVSSWLQERLAEGTIELGNPHTKWLSPLLVALGPKVDQAPLSVGPALATPADHTRD